MPTSTNAIYQAAARLWKPWLQREALSTLSRGEELASSSSSCTHPACCFCRRLLLPAGEAWPAPGQPQHHPLLQPQQSHQQHDRPGRAVPVAAGHPGGVGQEQGEGPVPRHHGTTAPRSWFFAAFGRNPAAVAASSVCPPQVYIIAHVPVGYLPFARDVTAIREQHNQRLVAICRKYSHVIAGHFYGHTHRDSVMVLLDEQGWKTPQHFQPFGFLFNFPPNFIFFSVLQANPSILCLCLRR